jgi:hypothetical protein
MNQSEMGTIAAGRYSNKTNDFALLCCAPGFKIHFEGKKMKRTTAVFSAAFLSLILCLSSAALAASAPRPEAQPEMTAALEHLREAKKALEAASHDKGGHRAKAIAHVNEAIREVEAGIQFDSTHTSPEEKKMEKH